MWKINLKGMLFLFCLFSIGKTDIVDTCSICGDSLTILTETTIAFPHTLPGDTITIRKFFNTRTNQISLLSNSSKITTLAELDTYEIKDYIASGNRYFHLSERMNDDIGRAGDSELIRVEVVLLDYPNTQKPLMDKPTFLSKHGLKEVTLPYPILDNRFKKSSDTFIADILKWDICLLNYDVNILEIEPYIDPSPMKIVLKRYLPTINSIPTYEYFTINGKKLNKNLCAGNGYKGNVVIVSEKSSAGLKTFTKKILAR